MKITAVTATWLHVPIPEDRQHVSDFGRVTSFDATLVRIDTDAGITGWGESFHLADGSWRHEFHFTNGAGQ